MNQLKEKQGKIRESKTKSGRREVTIIKEGWGSSGYYSGDVLKEFGPKAFPAGTRMFLDHPTLREEAERPERSVKDWVGKLATTPRLAGIDLISEAEIFDHWKPVIDSIAEDVGLSIVAPGYTEAGSAGGKEGPIIKEIYSDPLNSVDFVTEAGAGGAVGQLIESARHEHGLVVPKPESVREMLERLRESRNVRDWLVAKLHLSFTECADMLAMDGYLNQDERIALSAAIGSALDAFNADVDSKAPELASRDPYESSSTTPVLESGSKRKKESKLETEELQRKLSEAETTIRQKDEEISSKDEKLQEAVTERDEAKTRAERAEDALLITGAKKIAESVISRVEGLPDRAAARAADTAVRGELPTNSDGKLDEERVRESAKKAVKEELEYLTGKTVEGELPLREAGTPPAETPVTTTTTNGGGGDSNEKLVEAFKKSGMSEEAAKQAAEGR